MDETKKKLTIKELLNMDLKTLKNLKSKDKKSASVTSSKKKIKEPKKRIPNKAVAFDIGSNSIKIVAARYDKRKVYIDNLIDIPTPEGAVIDGKILDSKALKDIVNYIISENKINYKDAIFTTDSTSIINREVIIPKVESDEIPTVIRFELQQFLPINLNDYILEYTILEEIENEFDRSQKYRVNVIAFPEITARSYYDLFKEESGLKPYALDIIHNSINKLINLNSKINEIESKEGETIAMIDMGAESIKINIYKNGKLEFTRIMKNGGNDIDITLSEKLKISKKLVESTKIEKANLEYLEDNEVNSVVREVVDEWLSNLGRIIKFYENKKVGNKIDKIFIYGGTSNIQGIEDKIQERFSITTNKIRSFDKVEISRGNLSKEPIEKYINAIASIIRL